MRSGTRIAVASVVLLVAFNGVLMCAFPIFGKGMAAIIALAAVGIPLGIGTLIRSGAKYEAPFLNAAINCWPFAIIQLWPLMRGIRAWDYSYTLSASESDVVGFMLYLFLISVWMFVSARQYSAYVDPEPMARTGAETGPAINPKMLVPVLGSLVLITGVVCGLALTRHATFHSKAWDLAIFAQLAGNIAAGDGVEISIRGLTNVFSDHFPPIMFLLAYLRMLFGGGSESLIILQAVAVTSGIVPLLMILTKRGYKDWLTPSAVALIYSCYAPLVFLLLDDFHPMALVVPAFLWAFWFLETKRMTGFFVSLIVAGSCQEEAWIVVGMVGLYIALFRGYKITGWITLIVSWSIFFLLIVWFIPSQRVEGDYFYIHRYAYLGGSAGEIAKSLVRHPGLWLKSMFGVRSIAFVLMMLLPLALLPLRRPKVLFIIIPTVFYTLISGYDIQKSIFHQYTAPLIPFLMLALIDGLGKSRDGQPLPGKALIIAGCAFASVCTFSMLLWFPVGGFPEIYKPHSIVSEEVTEEATMLELADQKVSVSTISKYAPHLIGRRNLTLFPDLEWNGHLADAVLVDGKELIAEDERKKLGELLQWSEEGKKYRLSSYSSGVFLFEKPGMTEVKSISLRSSDRGFKNPIAASTGQKAPEYSIRGKIEKGVPFAENDHDRSENTISLYWLMLEFDYESEFPVNRFFAVRCVDDAGEPIFVYHHFPYYGIHPDYWDPETILEMYLIDPKLHQLKPLRKFGTKEPGTPAKLYVLPMDLPEGWTNSLDEYVTNLEQTSGIDWDEAYVIDLNVGK